MRGTAVNQDGASNGLTAPNGPSQERVIRQALANAGLSPADVDAVEAHGTGTTLGDPIEAQALLATYGQERSDGPLRLGSIKSNLGHTQAAAGVAGVIKMVMALRHGELPRTLHVDEPSPHVDWTEGEVRLLTEPEPWPADGRPRRAGISSFGISGTNAHVIVEEAPRGEQEPEGDSGRRPVRPATLPLVVSGRSEEAMRAQAGRLRENLLAHPDLDLADVSFSLTASRESFEHRGVAIGSGRNRLLAGLEALAAGEAAPGVHEGTARSTRTAFLFSGQGAQRAGMGTGLAAAFPVFAAAFDEATAALEERLGIPLKEIMSAPADSEEAALLNHTEATQAALFAHEVSLFRLLESFGLRPDQLIGHSIGELVAAHVAGVMSLEDAATLVAARGRLMGALPAGGAMLAVEAREAELGDLPEGVSLAAVNSPSSLVLSGAEPEIERLEAEWGGRERRTTRLRVSHAFHSQLMEPMLEELGEIAAGLELNPPRIPIVSNLTGKPVGEELADPGYWVRQVRQPVRFAAGVAALAAAGIGRYLELGPDAVLSAPVAQCLEETGLAAEPLVACAQRSGHVQAEALLAFLAGAHADGAEVDWEALHEGHGARTVELPTYAFQRQPYWLAAENGAGDLRAAGLEDAGHPLLGAVVGLAGEGGSVFTGRLSLASHPWLADHAVFDLVLLPGTGLVELALNAGARVGCELLEELTLEAPLVLPESGVVQLQVAVASPAEEGPGRRVEIFSRLEGAELGEGGEGGWVRHAVGVLAPAPDEPEAGSLGAEWPPAGAEPLDLASLYDRLALAGFGYGPAFQGARAAWRRGEELFAEVALDEEQAREASRFGLHPALLDAAFHPLIGTTGEGLEAGRLPLPFLWSEVRLARAGAASLRVRIAPEGEEAMRIDAVDETGAPVLSIGSLLPREVDASQLAGAGRRGDDPLFGLAWSEVELPTDGDAATGLAILGDLELPDLDADRFSDLAALLDVIDAGARAPQVVLARPPAAGGNEAEAARSATAAALALLQAWLAADSLGDARLVILTEGAVAVDPSERPDPVAASVRGLVRSAQAEHPGRFGLIDHDGRVPAAALAMTAEPELALRGGRAHAPHLERLARGEEEMPGLDPDGTVLITGATGALGALIARHLVTQGARRLLLLSRRGEAAPGAAELVEELTAAGCEATLVACDAAERAALAGVIDAIPPAHPLTAVIHAAGVMDDATIEKLDREQLDRVMRPKVDAAQNLDELTRGLDLAELVLFSSAAPLLGGAGQGNYAAANAFLDALAQRRRTEGLPAVSIAWGLWGVAESRLAGDLEVGELEALGRLIRARTAMLPIEPDAGLALFDGARASGTALVAAVQLDMGTLRGLARENMLPPLLRRLVRVPSRGGKAGGGSLAVLLAGVAEPEWTAVLDTQVRRHVAAVLGHESPEAIDAKRSFKDLGFDSLTAVELRNRLGRATGLRLSPTLVFDHPTPDAVVEFLRASAGQEGARAPAAVRATGSEEPIAIVGMSCRYPGDVDSPEALWDLVAGGVDAISGFPENRGWDLESLYDPDPEHLGTSYAREGGFLHRAAEFDAGFFGISPREATAMDPQQRLLLECAWETFESAGLPPASVRDSDTGVFTGLMYQDYGMAATTGSLAAETEGYMTTGSAGSVASGRLSYLFGLKGPALSVDTACSSSLVAMHLACQALRGGECTMAVAGGACVMPTPFLFVEFSRQRGLSPDGRCRSFAAGADGTGWSEGVGLLLLERLSDAERNGHEVLATVRGSAVNQDGASNGLTAPNGPSQERVIRQALANAGLGPADVDAVEAHGTGTTLGDPIEAQALLATYGQERADGPLRLGSIKSNIGHAQAAAGVAGVIKMVMALREGELPPTLHVDEPSPHIDWSAGAVELLREPAAWPRGDRPRRAGISSFGISGTNAHLIVEEPPRLQADRQGQDAGERDGQATEQGPVPARPIALTLSARSGEAMRAQADRLRAHLTSHRDLDLADLSFSLTATREGFEHRAVVLGGDRERLLAGLEAVAGSGHAPGVQQGQARSTRTAFVFSGQGAQRPCMGSGLAAAFPVFAETFEEATAALEERLGIPLREIIDAPEGSEQAELLDHTEATQAALFAHEVSLFRLLDSLGLSPDLLIGHSIGELVAAHVAGVMSLEDAATLVAARGRLMGALPEGGAMLAVEAEESELGELPEGVSVAGINSPTSLVLSGEEGEIGGLEEIWRDQGRRVSRLRVSHAFHSHLMEPMLEEFGEVAASLEFRPPKIPIVSNLTGALAGEEITDPGYWVRHVRQPVRFADGVAALAEAGVGRYLELGPDAVLSAPVAECLEGVGLDAEPLVACSQRQGQDQAEALLAFLARAHADGAEVDWAALHEGSGARAVDLPTYAFQRERYWLDGPRGAGDLRSVGLEDAGHPLLGAVVGLAGDGGSVATGRLSLASHPWLADHAVFDVVLLPGTGFVELALNAGAHSGCEVLEELTLEAPLVLPEDGVVQLQVTVGEPGEDTGRRRVEIFSRLEREPGAADGSDGEWVRHASGAVAPGDAAAGGGTDLGEQWPPAGAEPIAIEPLYERLAQVGFGYGPAFQGVRAIWRRGEELFAEVALDGEQARDAARFGVHPALLDSVFHPVIGTVGDRLEAGRLPLPFLWSDVRLARAGAASLRVRIAPEGEEAMRIDATDETGAPVLSVGSLLPREVDASQLAGAGRRGDDPLLGLTWSEVELPTDADAATGLAILGPLELPDLEADRHPDLSSLTVAIEAGEPPPQVVLAAAPSGEGNEAEAARAATAAALGLLQSWLADETLADARLVILTEGGVAVDPAERPDPVAASVRGLVRGAQAEHPGRFALIDHDGVVPPAALTPSAEPELALRGGKAYAPHLERLPRGEEEMPGLDPDGTVLVTGATGAVGNLVARHLATQGAHRLLLLSRRGEDAPGARELVAELAAAGCEATVVACDAADRAALARALDAIPPEHPLTAVIHVAGVLEDATIEKLDAEKLDRVMRPKADAALNLDELTRELDLAELVLFSSAAPLLGGAGQGNYAAANAFLDALAQRRRAEGLPAVSIAWGLWGVDSEIAGQLEGTELERFAQQVRARMAILPIEPDRSLDLLDLARAAGEALVAPLRLDPTTMRELAERQALPALLRQLVRAPERRERASEGALAQQLAAAPPSERPALALAAVRSELAAVLGHESPAAIDPQRSMHELGIDSLSAVELRNRLSHATGLRLPASMIFGFPEPAALAQHLCDLLAERGDAGAAAEPPPAAVVEGTLGALLRVAHERGAILDAVPMLVEASKLAESFGAAADLPEPPALLALGQGEHPEKLICVPSFMPGSGPHQFARLARGVGGRRGVLALSLPGFRAAEPLPATWAAAIDALAHALMPIAEAGSFALAGYSAGGTLAHALAERCCEAGLEPTAVVMIDTHMSSEEAARRATLAAVLGRMVEERNELIALDDVNLLAMACYLRLLDEWEPAPLEVRSLRLTAAESLGQAATGPLPDWQATADAVEAPGDHFSMIELDAATTADAVVDWLAGVADLTPR